MANDSLFSEIDDIHGYCNQHQLREVVGVPVFLSNSKLSGVKHQTDLLIFVKKKGGFSFGFFGTKIEFQLETSFPRMSIRDEI